MTKQLELLQGEQLALCERVRLAYADWIRAEAPPFVRDEAVLPDGEVRRLPLAQMLGAFLANTIVASGEPEAPPFAILLGLLEGLHAHASPGELERALELSRESYMAAQAKLQAAASADPQTEFEAALEQLQKGEST